jgi:7-cyano-7-deazaguanine reductase
MGQPSLAVLPNANPTLISRVSVTTPMPPMCPRSQNPQPGSTVTITYCAGAVVLEVYSVAAYLRQYVGGRAMEGGATIRDMEQTIQQIALDARAALGVDVAVRGDLILQHGQRMVVEVMA